MIYQVCLSDRSLPLLYMLNKGDLRGDSTSSFHSRNRHSKVTIIVYELVPLGLKRPPIRSFKEIDIYRRHVIGSTFHSRNRHSKVTIIVYELVPLGLKIPPSVVLKRLTYIAGM